MNLIKILKKIRFRGFMLLKFIPLIPDYIRFQEKDTHGHAPATLMTVYPRLSDKTAKTPFEKQYLYHTAWAARCVQKNNPTKHTDFGSLLYFSTLVSAFVPVDFYDYRPADLHLSGLDSKFGNLVDIDAATGSFESVSCMHTIEHIGLGRYGDPIDPEGDLKAINELKRVTANGGALLIVVPMGVRQHTEFNGHRVYAFDTFVSYFDGFDIVDFSYIPESDDRGGIIMNTTKEVVGNDHLGCGCFWFKKRGS
jgi:hypothetical protein